MALVLGQVVSLIAAEAESVGGVKTLAVGV